MMMAVGKPGAQPRIWSSEPVQGNELWFEVGDVVVEGEAIDPLLTITADGTGLEVSLDALRENRRALAIAERDKAVSAMWEREIAPGANFGQTMMDRIGACYTAAQAVIDALNAASTAEAIRAVDVAGVYP